MHSHACNPVLSVSRTAALLLLVNPSQPPYEAHAFMCCHPGPSDFCRIRRRATHKGGGGGDLHCIMGTNARDWTQHSCIMSR